ncbi:MAG: ABC transporter ATP-binding protein [Bacteroidetes bacterium]|nr:ABC transporter ATP-binding protein [Bacteroidota bacterium]
MNTVIKVASLSKHFKLYRKRIDRLKDNFLPSAKKEYYTVFKALDDLTFDIVKGQTVGIVGRNGSGKSTLLQVICGILRQTRGELEVNGRISALLELGAGFNPEFTGRENVYLNAAILGMPKEEIDLYFDDILAFADIGRFIDQPVKTYSSGMYVRLAFAVAINVKPDILIIDEALSVGDTLFQAKCFAKFRDFQQQGITILFVTHSMELLARYCDTAILLDMGKLLMQGPAKEVIDEYNRLIVDCASPTQAKSQSIADKSTELNHSLIDELSHKSDTSPETLEAIKENLPGKPIVLSFNPKENRYGNGKAEIVDFGVNVLSGEASQTFVHGEKYLFWVQVTFNAQLQDPIVAFTVKDVKGLIITGTNTSFKDKESGLVNPGDTLIVSFEQTIRLNPGEYLLSFGCAGFDSDKYAVYDRRFDVIPFQVIHDKSALGIFDMNSTVDIQHIEKK